MPQSLNDIDDSFVDPFANESPEFIQNPYPALKRLRERAPIYHNVSGGYWVFTAFDDISELLRAPQLSNRVFSMTGQESELHLVNRQVRENWVMNTEGSKHTRLRKSIQSCFSPTHVGSLSPFIEAQVENLLERMQKKEIPDLVADLAIPLQIRNIAHLMAIPEEDQAKFTNWCKQISGAPLAGQPGAFEVVKESRDYFANLVKARSEGTGHDVISKLVLLSNESKISIQETIDTCVLLLFGAFETTAALIANGLFALLSHPEQLEILRNDFSLMDQAIDEMLRYDTPAKSVGRAVALGFTYKNIDFQRGDFLQFSLSAANRDPSRFENPDIFDIKRERKENLSFGNGVHFCIGTTLAKLTARLAIAPVLERFTNIRLTPSAIVFNTSQSIRMVAALPVYLS